MDIATSINNGLLQQEWSAPVLFVAIILLSYLLEDLAIVTAATLAVQQVMPTSVALLAIFLGISSGDLALYLIGKAAKKVPWLRYRLLRFHRGRRVRRQLQQHALVTLFVVRFVPGLRTVGFTLSGFVDIEIKTFFIAVLSASALWTALVFGSLFQLGHASWIQSQPMGWLLIPCGVFVLWLVNKLIAKRFVRNGHDTAC